jgi:hypothetical protein
MNLSWSPNTADRTRTPNARARELALRLRRPPTTLTLPQSNVAAAVASETDHTELLAPLPSSATLSRRHTARAGGSAFALVGCVAAFALVILSVYAFTRDESATPLPGFVAAQLGARSSAPPTSAHPSFTARVNETGVSVSGGGMALSLAAENTSGAWSSFERGVTRRLAFGSETVTLAPGRVEEYQTVDRRVGFRRWRWNLALTNATPMLMPDGSVGFNTSHGRGSFRIPPPQVFDSRGVDVTPVGTRWELRRASQGWWLELPLSDAALPLPYVIDPAVTGQTATAASLARQVYTHWTFGFTTSSSGALASGDTITVGFPTWTGGSIPSSPVVELLSPSGFTSTCTATASNSGGTVTVTLANASGQTCALGNSTAATLKLKGIDNTASTGSKNFTIKTSKDTTNATASATIVTPTSSSSISFAGAPQTAGARSTWTTSFTTSSSGGLVDGSTITLGFTTGFTVSSSPTITLGSGFSNCTASATNSSGTVTVTLAGSSCSLSASTAASLSVAYVTNPSTTGSKTLTFKNSSDTTQVSTSATIAAATAPTAVSFSAASRAASASTSWTVGLTTSSGGGLSDGDTITVAFPSGFSVGSSPSITLVSGFSNCSATASGSFATATITLANSGGTCSVGSSSAVSLTIGSVTNGSMCTCSASSFTVKTSVDTATASPASSIEIFGSATKVSFTTQPSNTPASSAFAPQPAVAILDGGDRLVANDNTTQVTLQILTNPASGTLTCTTNPITVTNGIGTFSGCKINNQGNGYSLTTSDNASLSNLPSNSFNITPPATQIAFTQQPSSATAGAPFGTQPKVTVKDASGNAITTGADASASISIAILSGGGTLQGTATVQAVAGVATFTNLRIDTSGAHVLRASTTLPVPGAVTADSSSFTVAGGTATQISLSGPTSSLAGADSDPLTATLTDVYGNATTRATNVATTPTSDSFGSDVEFKTVTGTPQESFVISAGTSSVTFVYLDDTVGSPTISFTNDASTPTLSDPAPIAWTVSEPTDEEPDNVTEDIYTDEELVDPEGTDEVASSDPDVSNDGEVQGSGIPPDPPDVVVSTFPDMYRVTNADGQWFIARKCSDKKNVAEGYRVGVGPGYIYKVIDSANRTLVNDNQRRTTATMGNSEELNEPGYINAINGGLGTFGFHYARGSVDATPAGEDLLTAGTQTETGRPPKAIEGRMCAGAPNNNNSGVYKVGDYRPVRINSREMRLTMDVYLKDQYGPVARVRYRYTFLRSAVNVWMSVTTYAEPDSHGTPFVKEPKYAVVVRGGNFNRISVFGPNDGHQTAVMAGAPPAAGLGTGHSYDPARTRVRFDYAPEENPLTDPANSLCSPNKCFNVVMRALPTTTTTGDVVRSASSTLWEDPQDNGDGLDRWAVKSAVDTGPNERHKAYPRDTEGGKRGDDYSGYSPCGVTADPDVADQNPPAGFGIDLEHSPFTDVEKAWVSRRSSPDSDNRRNWEHGGFKTSAGGDENASPYTAAFTFFMGWAGEEGPTDCDPLLREFGPSGESWGTYASYSVGAGWSLNAAEF